MTVEMSTDPGRLLDVLEEWRSQDSSSPVRYQRAWDRALELVTPHWRGVGMNIDGPVLADGGAALAIALYLLAEEQQIDPSEVTRVQVEALLERPSEDISLQEVWEERLRGLGHDLDADGDPVAARWRTLLTDYSDKPGDPEPWVGSDFDFSFRRWGPAFVEGLRKTLAPRFGLAF